MKIRVGISPSSFAQEDKTPLELLESSGVVVISNPLGRRLSEDEILRFLKDEQIDGLIAGLEPLTKRVLESASPRLKAVARLGIGVTNVDQAACSDLGIRFSFTPDGPTESVAEMTGAALLCLARDLELMNREMHKGQWPKLIGRSLKELQVLIVGYGRIGRAVAERLALLGCAISVYDPFLPEDMDYKFPRVGLHEGLSRANVVSLHASGDTPLLSAPEFEAARSGIILLNSARGELVDERALLEALDSGKVSKAWFDAFWKEPYKGKLLKYPQVLLTPHSSTYTRSCRLSMESEAASNILRDLEIVKETT